MVSNHLSKQEMATAEVMAAPPLKVAKEGFQPLINTDAVRNDGRLLFDPAKHLKFTPPSKIISMEDIGLPAGTGVSPVAVSEPFPLFSEEAIRQMRAEVLSDSVWKNCQYSSNLAQCQLRGFAPE